MSIFDNIDPNKQKSLYKSSLKTGDVFLKEFKEAEHKKLFIIAGISSEKVFICSVFINSEIHPSLSRKPNIHRLQIPLLKSRNKFLKHDSYANCSYLIYLKSEEITNSIIEKTCKVIGNIHMEDLKFIQTAIIESGLLTEEQIQLYFNK